MSVTSEQRASATEVRHFQVDVSDEALDDLRKRITATNWPEKEPVADDSQGFPLALIQELARYWATDYDWRTCEARLNELPQFITEIDGLDIHFIHVLRPRGCAAARRQPRLARLDHRAAEDHRPADRSHGTRCERVRCLPCGDPLDARLRVLGQAQEHRLGP